MGKKFPLDAVVFDMDGLLLDSERRSQEILLISAAQVGAPLSAEVSLGLVGKNSVDGPKYLEQHLGSAALVNDLLRTFVGLYDAEIEQGRIPLKKGVADVLDTLDEFKIPRAIATSTATERARRKLERLSVLHRFDAVIGGDQVVHGKPSPDIYLKACLTIGHSPAGSLACEDSPAGLEAATRAGLRTVLVPDLIEPTEQSRALAWRVVRDLTEVSRLIRAEFDV